MTTQSLPGWLHEVNTCVRTQPTRQRPSTQGVWMWVDAAVAEALLTMNTWNRRLRPHVVEQYADMMRAGLWDEDVPQVIAFDTDLKMADGQHRCHAIIKASAAYWCLIFWGMRPASRLNIDRGRSRNSADNMVMAGEGDLLPGDSKRALEMANAFVQGMRPSKISLSPGELLHVYQTYGRSLRTASDLFAQYPKNSPLARAMVRATVARALYHGLSEDVARRFVDLIVNGYSEGRPGDRTAITFRNEFIVQDGKVKKARNSNDNADIYARCAAALRLFERGEDRQIVRPLTTDPWPLDSAADLGRPDRMALDLGRYGAGRQAVDCLVETPKGSLPS